jgi:diguanylate cyclase (GGDEF)-like protein
MFRFLVRLIRHVTDLLPTASTVASRQGASERLASAVTALAGFAALAIALAVPLSYFIAAYETQAGVLELRAEVYANAVVDTVGQSPLLWNAFLGDDAIDLSGFSIAAEDDPHTMVHPPEYRRVFARNGRMIVDVPPAQPLPWPILKRRLPVLQNDHQLGSVQIERSFRPVVIATTVIGAISLCCGILLVVVLRIVPLRLMREALERASYLSAHDHLTGLPNRALMGDRLAQALATARRSGAHVAMLCLDLDHFKQVNDTLGHAAGDQLLRAVVARLRASLRDTDTLARMGGDEFAVVIPEVRQPRDVEIVAARMIEAIRAPFDLDGQQAFVGLSVGIALGEGDAVVSELSMHADMALYQAKEAGRGVYRFFAPEMNERLQRRRVLETALHQALDKGEITLHYQPQIDSASGDIIGAEALMRWNLPGAGSVPPDVFIPIAEETGMIGTLGTWLLHEACCEAAGWSRPISIAVNVSPVQFRHGNFTETVQAALARSGLDPNRLELEVTEGILLNDTNETLGILSILRDMGVRIAMDDFGTGYASLGYLQKFRFDKIKIDKTFINQLGKNQNSAAIVRAVVGLSEALGLTANAEGVETDEQIALLRAYGCQEVQGFHYWAPMPGQNLRELITGTSADAVPGKMPASPG